MFDSQASLRTWCGCERAGALRTPALKNCRYFRAFFLTAFFTAFFAAFLMAFFFLAAISIHLLLVIRSALAALGLSGSDQCRISIPQLCAHLLNEERRGSTEPRRITND